jgi:purine nucleosidase
MPTFPLLTDAQRLARLEAPTQRVPIVLDTDTYNEIDDQFAVVYALFSADRLDVRAIHAAPFHNDRSAGPGDGMEKSHEEILRLLSRVDRSPEGFVLRGSERWLPAADEPVDSPAARDLIARAMAMPANEPLYVVAIGAITNVASALLMEPRLVERIVVCWLGGHASTWHRTNEFNLRQDLHASRVILDSGVPLALFPCVPVVEHLRTTLPEMERYIAGRGAIGDYLFQIYRDYVQDKPGRSKVIWDLAPLAWLINPGWAEMVSRPSPRLTDQLTWSHDPHRHLIREAIHISRDGVFADLFAKIERQRR